MNQATKLKAKAGRLQEEGAQLLDKASAEKGKAAELKVGHKESCVERVDTEFEAACRKSIIRPWMNMDRQ